MFLSDNHMVEISCDAHEWMSAYIYVTDHPYAAITGADGSFSMTDVPAGTWSAKVWHENLGEKEAEVTVERGEARVRADITLEAP